MAKDHDVGLTASYPFQQGCSGVRAIHNVMDEAPAALQFYQFSRSETGLEIVIAQHGRYGRNDVQLVDDLLTTEISGVEDMMNSRKQFRDPRIQIPVRIGDKTKDH